jgi:hypothetical protein
MLPIYWTKKPGRADFSIQLNGPWPALRIDSSGDQRSQRWALCVCCYFCGSRRTVGAGSKKTGYGSLRVHGCIVLASSEGGWLLRVVRDNAETTAATGQCVYYLLGWQRRRIQRNGRRKRVYCQLPAAAMGPLAPRTAFQSVLKSALWRPETQLELNQNALWRPKVRNAVPKNPDKTVPKIHSWCPYIFINIVITNYVIQPDWPVHFTVRHPSTNLITDLWQISSFSLDLYLQLYWSMIYMLHNYMQQGSVVQH